MNVARIAWVGLVGIAGCGAEREAARADPSPAVTASVVPVTADAAAPAIARIDENLGRLRQLDVFEVGALVLHENTPAGRRADAERLQKLADAAEVAVVHLNFGYACTEHVDVNLEALRALDIVGIGSLIVSAPENNPICYNLPCQEDVDASNAANLARDEKLESIALATKDL